MSSLVENDLFAIINPKPEHFRAIQDVCRKVYPFSKPWSIDQLESHQSYFPDGQLIVVEKATGRIVGLAFSLIIPWDEYSHQDSWKDFTSGGFFHNHNPKKGTTLYGAEVMVDPEYQGRGIGSLLYRGREAVAKKYKLKRIRAGARLRGYSKFQDKMRPEEYAKRVVNKELYDPTLSFQVNKGFVVLHVAKNYLFNDPESLGYAAVIEWLNPEVATERDRKRQQEGVRAFLENEVQVLEHLPRELRRLVRKMTTSLGKTISECEGEEFYSRIEFYRQQLKKTRHKKELGQLEFIRSNLLQEKRRDQLKIAHAFSLLLELINVCEAAYRTWRQQHKLIPSPQMSKIELHFVLTAHPTEARSKQVIQILRRLIQLLVEGQQNNFVFNDQELFSHLRLLWLQPLVKVKPPTVLDEAEYIYSIIFDPTLFDFILTSKSSYDLKLRTWVGGDKDGHPGVDQAVMTKCLEASRRHIIKAIRNKLSLLIIDIEKIIEFNRDLVNEVREIRQLSNTVCALNSIKNKDGREITKWRGEYRALLRRSSLFTQKHHAILLVNRILEIFPALVFPIELREDAKEIKAALKDKDAPISRMLDRLRNITDGTEILNYVSGLVISNCEVDSDLSAACELVRRRTKSSTLPTIPLFESKQSLEKSDRILESWLGTKENYNLVHREWKKTLEVMLGYSDSAKQMGALPSRHLIKRSMHQIESTLKNLNLKPVFFHGSGGSVARGGGSLREQIAWWSNEAVQTPKMTIQGEMIQRVFATKEILNSQCLHISNEARLRRNRKAKITSSVALKEFTDAVQKHYVQLISDKPKLKSLLEATPYKYLDVLKIGSRPSKRSPTIALESLRAIPWVLCWTQTRLLLPSWWGIGSAWMQLNSKQKQDVKVLAETDPFLSSFIKTLGFTLAKVELQVWEQYVRTLHSDSDNNLINEVRQEYERAKKFVFETTGSKQLVWYRPWLQESIRLRSAYIHILNLLQIQAMKENDEPLLKETLVGIACGMLTTG